MITSAYFSLQIIVNVEGKSNKECRHGKKAQDAPTEAQEAQEPTADPWTIPPFLKRPDAARAGDVHRHCEPKGNKGGQKKPSCYLRMIRPIVVPRVCLIDIDCI